MESTRHACQHSALALLCLLMVLVGCTSTASRKISPEEQARIQQIESQRAEARKKGRIKEAALLLRFSDDDKVAFMREFLRTLRLPKNVNCDTIAAIGYYDSKTYVAQCANGEKIAAMKQRDGKLLGASGFWVQGVRFDEAVWFIGSYQH